MRTHVPSLQASPAQKLIFIVWQVYNSMENDPTLFSKTLLLIALPCVQAQTFPSPFADGSFSH